MKHELMELASSLESLTVELEHLASLLQLYVEHREDELGGVSIEEPYTIIGLLARQKLGEALLTALEDKTRIAKDLAEQAVKTGYELARSPEAASKE